jgi:hypothetical protein
MTTAARHARHLALTRAERAAGHAFGCLDEVAVQAHQGAHRLAATATGAAFVAAVAATIAWAF